MVSSTAVRIVLVVSNFTGVRDLDYTRLMRKVPTTNLLNWQGNVDYRKSALDYANLGCAFRNCFPFDNVLPSIHKYDDRENH